MLKFENTAEIGDRIRAYDFEPMPGRDDCKITNDTVINYRYYYLKEKKDMLKYTNREIPHWIQEGIDFI